jgi:Tfp pilus assembly protein PilE
MAAVHRFEQAAAVAGLSLDEAYAAALLKLAEVTALRVNFQYMEHFYHALVAKVATHAPRCDKQTQHVQLSALSAVACAQSAGQDCTSPWLTASAQQLQPLAPSCALTELRSALQARASGKTQFAGRRFSSQLDREHAMELLRRLPEESLRQAAGSLGLSDGAPATTRIIRLRDVRYGHPDALQPIYGYSLLNLDAVPGLEQSHDRKAKRNHVRVQP